MKPSEISLGFIFGIIKQGVNNMFYFDELNGKKILKSDLLDEKRVKNITAFFTPRGDLPIKNDFAKRILTPNQTHSDNIEIVDSRNEYPNTDGLILTKPDTAIFLRFADCTPLIFYDTKNNIGAISHAGWRGTAAKIGVKTVQKMETIFGTKPDKIVALIGPAISVCCYEVNGDVKTQLLSTVKNKDNLYNGKKVDLKKINAEQLKEIGVEQIDICPFCTSCNNDLFYSYRKENGTKDRHFAVLKLK